MSLPKPCIAAGCPQLTFGGPRCASHQRALDARRNASPERAEYATSEYRAARLAVLGQPCWRCGELADTADHVKPLREGGTWRDGLRPACRSCNSDWRTL